MAGSQVSDRRAGDRLIPTFCPMCGPGPGCGIYATVRDGKFIGVRGMKESPLNRGRLCPKAHAAPQWVYSPQRLKTPLRRIGPKGEGRFAPVSWDEALDEMAAKLLEQKEKYGPESLAILSPARRTYSSYLTRFLVAHGSPNYGHSGICFAQRILAFSYTFGAMPTPDAARTRLLIEWAAQPIFSGGSRGPLRRFLAARDHGARIIAVKPTMEPDVSLADVWMPIRPGTDAALALAMLNVIVGEGLYDREFVEKWTYGFDRLQTHVTRYTPEWAEPVTGLSAGQIREVARLYATTKPAAIDVGNGLEHAPGCNDAVRAIAILMAITGNLDRPGGNIFPSRGAQAPKPIEFKERLTRELVDKLVAPEFPRPFQPMVEGTSSAYYGVLESVLTGDPYPIRAIIAPGTQPTVSTRGTGRVIEALKKLDFYAVVDVMQTADMKYADLVIPVASMLETDHPFEFFEGWLMARNRVIEPLGEYKSDYEFWIDLAVRMGYGQDFWNGDLTACMNDQLSPFGMTMEELRAHPTGIAFEPGPPVYEKYERVFANRSTRLSHEPLLPEGKVAIYNTTFERFGFNPLPEWREPPESPAGTPHLLKRYPLVFSDFHTSKVYNAGWLRNTPYLREAMPDPTVQMHPATAANRGIEPGDWVVVESPHGSLRMRAEINPGIRPDCVMALHGWWQGCDELQKPSFDLLHGANTNCMYSTDRAKAWDPVVTAMSSQTLVEVRKDGKAGE